MNAIPVPLRHRGAPAPGPVPPPAGRPSLRVVDDRHLRARARRRRVRAVVAVIAALAALSLLGMAAFHAALVEGQVELSRLEGEVADEQARYQRLRLRVAELESPERIVAAAQERLGMVPPPGVTYLSPSGPAGAPADTAPDAPGGDGVQAWAAVKSHLADRP